MKKVNLLVVIATVLFTAQTTSAQPGKNDPPVIQPNGQSEYTIRILEQQRKAAERVGGLDENGMIKQPPADKPHNPPVSAEEKERRKERNAEFKERAEYVEEINNKLLRAPEKYYERHASFLAAEQTGLGRIFPDKNCGKGKIVSVQEIERCADIPLMKGGGSLFSFRSAIRPVIRLNAKNSFSTRYLHGISDVHFANGNFYVGDEAVQNIIGALGELDLAEVTAETKTVKVLSDIKPSKTVSELTIQNQELKKGIDENGILYANSAPAKLNETYILRSIGYRHESRPQAFHNTDLLVAFKVVGREADGSIVILWKQLREKGAPVLRNK